MSEIDSTLNVTIQDEDDSYRAKVDINNDLHTKSKLWNGTSEVTVTDNKLDVNSSATPALYTQQVNSYQTFSTTQTKINYTVPTNKQLHIVFMAISGRVSTVDIEWQTDGTPFTSMSLSGTNGTPTISFLVPSNAPFGPFAAGEVITSKRIAGDTNKAWSATMVGYLIDV